MEGMRAAERERGLTMGAEELVEVAWNEVLGFPCALFPRKLDMNSALDGIALSEWRFSERYARRLP